MDAKLAEQRRNLGVLIDQLNTDAVIADAALYAAKEREISDAEGAITRAEAALKRSAALARPAGRSAEEAESHGADIVSIGAMARELGAIHGRSADFSDALALARRHSGYSAGASSGFRSFGEQLQAVAGYAMSRGSDCDARLVRAPLDERFSRAPSGAGEVDPTGGGFLVQTDFSTAICMLAHDMGEILKRLNKIPISASANGLKIPGVDETSRATGSRWGGVQSYWLDEGTAPTASKPKFRMIEFNLQKLIQRHVHDR